MTLNEFIAWIEEHREQLSGDETLAVKAFGGIGGYGHAVEKGNMSISQKKVTSIINALFADLNDRKGLHINDCDEDVQREIRKKWRELITKAAEGNRA